MANFVAKCITKKSGHWQFATEHNDLQWSQINYYFVQKMTRSLSLKRLKWMLKKDWKPQPEGLKPNEKKK